MRNLGQLLPILIVIAGLCGSARTASAQPNSAVIMITAGGGPGCQGQNGSYAWVVAVYKPSLYGIYSHRANQRLVASLATLEPACTMIPIKSPVGTEIVISGFIAGGGSHFGLAPQVNDGPGCFNVEAYSVGLALANPQEATFSFNVFNPQDPNNIINGQGYGLFWLETFETQTMDGTDNAGSRDPFKVVGCGHKACPVSKTIYNTDTGLQPNPGCDVLTPIL